MTDNGTAVVVREALPALPLSQQPRGVIIQNMNDLARFAKTVFESGLVPRGLKNMQAVAIAVQFGLELGLTPLSALQNVGVVNNLPGLFGDAAKALVEQSGLLEDYDEYLEVNGQRVDELPGNPPDNARGVAISKRHGRRPKKTVFSVSMAKKAGLWGKQGPWSSYPERMLTFRARGFNLRDNFPDVLKGFRTVEELRDYPAGEAPEAPAPITDAERARRRAVLEGEAPAPAPEAAAVVVEQAPDPFDTPQAVPSQTDPAIASREWREELVAAFRDAGGWVELVTAREKLTQDIWNQLQPDDRIAVEAAYHTAAESHKPKNGAKKKPAAEREPGEEG